MSQKVVVITGATGNIGRKFTRYLEDKGGYELRLLCLNAEGDPAVTTADLSVPDPSWIDLFKGADAIVHLAGNPSNQADWGSLIAPNMDAVLNVYLAAARHGVRRVVAASSVWSVYGYRFSRDRYLPEMLPRPTNPYGMTKVMGERIGEAFYHSHGISGVAFRIGACRRGENLPDHDMGRGDWEQSCWVSNRDVCQGLEKAVLAKELGFEVLNLTSANKPSRWDIQSTRDVIGYEPEDGHEVKVGAVRRLQSLFAWTFGFRLTNFIRSKLNPRW